MKKPKTKKLYVTALSIVGVVFLLLIFIGISTYRNMYMNRKHILDSAHMQGKVMLQTIEAAARSVMGSEKWNEDALGRLIVEAGKNSGIAHVYLLTGHGIIKHYNDPEPVGKESRWVPDINTEDGIESRFIQLPGRTPVYEIATRFFPFPGVHSGTPDSRPQELNNTDAVLVLGLKMTAFEKARREDINHTIVMALILVALGAGAFFFTFVIRSYHLMNIALKQAQEYTSQVVANMANGLLSTNASGHIMSFNHLALELLGLDEKSAENKYLGDVLDLEKSGVLSTLSHGNLVIDREMIHPLPDGSKVQMVLSVTPIKDKSTPGNGAVIIIRDLREIKQLEEKVRRSEKLAAIGKLAAVVAHEIRNPLSSIRGFAQFLSHILKDNPKDMEYASIMVQEVDRINRVVNDLLTFSRPIELAPVPTDLSELVGHTMKLLEGDIHTSKVTLTIKISGHLGRVVLDPDQIKQVLINLTLNALHELSEGDELVIGARTNKSRRKILIWVEDNGPGIVKEHQKHVFDLFFTTREKGTGLGLAIVQKIVEDHGGSIWVQSPSPGKQKGCRFNMIFPQNDDSGSIA